MIEKETKNLEAEAVEKETAKKEESVEKEDVAKKVEDKEKKAAESNQKKNELKPEGDKQKKLFKKMSLNLVSVFNVLKKIPENNWIFTIIFFAIILVIAIWIWKDCIFNPQPNAEAKLLFENEKKELELKSRKIDRVIEKIKDRQLKYESAPDYSTERKLFQRKSSINNAQVSNRQVRDTDMKIIQ